MGMEKMPTPEEIAKMQNSRAVSDADLLKGGATLEATPDQVRNAGEEMDRSMEIKKYKEALDAFMYACKAAMRSAEDLKAMFEISEERGQAVDTSSLPAATEILNPGDKNTLEYKMLDINDKITGMTSNLFEQGLKINPAEMDEFLARKGRK